MSISSSSQYDITKWRVKGLITATHTESVSLARGIVAGMKGIFGGPSDIMNKKVDDVLGMVLEKLKTQVQSDECMVGVSLNFTEFGRSESNTWLSGIGTGTVLSPIGKSGGTRKHRKRGLKS